jgi:hypothetical protein
LKQNESGHDQHHGTGTQRQVIFLGGLCRTIMV